MVTNEFEHPPWKVRGSEIILNNTFGVDICFVTGFLTTAHKYLYNNYMVSLIHYTLYKSQIQGDCRIVTPSITYELEPVWITMINLPIS